MGKSSYGRASNAQRDIAAGSVTHALDVVAFRQELPEFDFELPRALDKVMDWMNAQ